MQGIRRQSSPTWRRALGKNGLSTRSLSSMQQLNGAASTTCPATRLCKLSWQNLATNPLLDHSTMRYTKLSSAYPSLFSMTKCRTLSTTTDDKSKAQQDKQKQSNNKDEEEVDEDEMPLMAASSEPEVCHDLIRREVAADLFHQYAQVRKDGVASLDVNDIRNLLREIGEDATPDSVRRLFNVADHDNNGVIDLQEFLEHYDFILGGNPARIILVIGGPGSGKGVLSERLQQRCGVVHLSSGDLLRTEVARGSVLGNQVRDIIARGELVSSDIIVALMKRRMRDHPGKRVLLDGFPRSLENAHDLVVRANGRRALRESFA